MMNSPAATQMHESATLKDGQVAVPRQDEIEEVYDEAMQDAVGQVARDAR